MGLFNRKPIYLYDVLTPYKLNIEKFNAKAAKTYPQLDYCRLIGETDKFNIYLFRDTSITLHEYLLRQERPAPKKVVYLGNAQKFNCVLGNKLFLMDYTSANRNFLHPNLLCVDIETGKQTAYDILSNENIFEWVAGMSYEHSQDCIESMSVQGDKVVMAITRHAKGRYDNLSEAESFIYQLHIRLENNHLKFTRIFPSGL